MGFDPHFDTRVIACPVLGWQLTCANIISPRRVLCENFILACGNACSSVPSLGPSVWLEIWFNASILNGEDACLSSKFDAVSKPCVLIVLSMQFEQDGFMCVWF